MTTGFNFGTFGSQAATPALGSAPAKTVASTPGFSFGNTSVATPAGFGLGATSSSGISFGTAATATIATATPFNAATTSAGFTLGGATGTGLLGAAKPTGFSFGVTATTTTAATTSGSTLAGLLGGGAGGLSTGTTSAATGGLFGGLGGGLTGGLGSTAASKPTIASTTTTISFGGLGGLMTSSAAPSGLFASTAVPATSVATVKRGLGGIDPKTTLTTPTLATAGKAVDTKAAVKETQVPNEISMTVEEFKKYVKQEKCVREQIARMSSKPMYRVQEEVASLKQLCVLVSSSLQRNAIAIDKLKKESAQELKHAEIAQRTKDTPPGLQYENTAPAEYFQRLVEGFEASMVLYRQQIDEMEQHLALMNQPAMLTPQELSMLLTKVQESFVALASQLYVIHEAVKAQKDHYLNYRKVFHADTTDVFEKRRRQQDTTPVSLTTGPTPFTGMSNAAAVAMVSAMNKTQPISASGNVLGMNTGSTAPAAFGGTAGTGLFNATTTAGSTFGTGSNAFSFGTNTAAVKPLGGTGTGLFSATSQAAPFGTSAAQPSFGLGGSTGLFGSPATGAAPAFGTASPFNTTSFPLQKPPAGNKRGKKV